MGEDDVEPSPATSEMSLRLASAPHDGHAGFAAPAMPWRRSNRSPQAEQAYS